MCTRVSGVVIFALLACAHAFYDNDDMAAYLSTHMSDVTFEMEVCSVGVTLLAAKRLLLIGTENRVLSPCIPDHFTHQQNPLVGPVLRVLL